MNTIYRLIREDEGVSLAEEGLLIGLIAVVCIAVLTALGTGLQGMFAQINAAL